MSEDKKMELVLAVGQYVATSVTFRHVASHYSGNDLLAEPNFKVELDVLIHLEVKDAGNASDAYIIKDVRADGLRSLTRAELHSNGSTLYLHGEYWSSGTDQRKMMVRVALHGLKKIE